MKIKEITQLKGKPVADEIINNIKSKVETFERKPKLVVIHAGDDPASAIYIRNKERRAIECGFEYQSITYTGEKTQGLVNLIRVLNKKPEIDGIIVQLPLPKSFNEEEVLKAIDPSKDVDGFHPMNVGKLWIGDDRGFIPATPLGTITLLNAYGYDHKWMQGKNALIINRSNLVGKPMAKLLLDQNMTVEIAHSRTKNIEDKIDRADLIVSAIGIPNYFNTADIRNKNKGVGKVLIDVSMNRDENGKLCGDLKHSPEYKSNIIDAITPVPGGIGQLTVATLMSNVLKSYLSRNNS